MKNSVMTGAGRFCVYAFLFGFFVFSQSSQAISKNIKDSKSQDSLNIGDNNSGQIDQFQWREHQKLSWNDFRGNIKAVDDESAAATNCGIGFKVNLNNQDHKPEVIVYNIFYASKSWVQPDAKIQSILDHEQGHFDLCEIYTRKLRERMNSFDFNVSDVKQALIGIYKEISNEYECRQQAYEQETVHGTNNEQQKKWIETIARELTVSNSYANK